MGTQTIKQARRQKGRQNKEFRKTRNRNLLCGNINSARFVARTTTRIITNKQKRSGGIRRLDKRIEGIKFQTLTVMKECESVK